MQNFKQFVQTLIENYDQTYTKPLCESMERDIYKKSMHHIQATPTHNRTEPLGYSEDDFGNQSSDSIDNTHLHNTLINTNHPSANEYHEVVIEHPTNETDAIRNTIKQCNGTAEDVDVSKIPNINHRKHPAINYTFAKMYGSKNAEQFQNQMENNHPFARAVRTARAVAVADGYNYKVSYMDSPISVAVNPYRKLYRTIHQPISPQLHSGSLNFPYIDGRQYQIRHSTTDIGPDSAPYTSVTMIDRDGSKTNDLTEFGENLRDSLDARHSSLKTKDGVFHTFYLKHGKDSKLGQTDHSVLLYTLKNRFPDVDADHIEIGTPHTGENPYVCHTSIDVPVGTKMGDLDTRSIPRKLNPEKIMHE